MFFLMYFSIRINTPNDGEVLLDYSKNRVDEKTLGLLFNLVRKCNLVTYTKIIITNTIVQCY